LKNGYLASTDDGTIKILDPIDGILIPVLKIKVHHNCLTLNNGFLNIIANYIIQVWDPNNGNLISRSTNQNERIFKLLKLALNVFLNIMIENLIFGNKIVVII
jgi:hypothetical protein